jgi:hypothetical protein
MPFWLQLKFVILDVQIDPDKLLTVLKVPFKFNFTVKKKLVYYLQLLLGTWIQPDKMYDLLFSSF